jgi:hypothetical protein
VALVEPALSLCRRLLRLEAVFWICICSTATAMRRFSLLGPVSEDVEPVSAGAAPAQRYQSANILRHSTKPKEEWL